jgi:16S rRNA (cytidine1402-2'-O)-methyltransferase
MSGTLYILASPIGNIDDITYRAVITIAQLDTLYCEDTRVTKRLLKELDLTVPLNSLHSHSSESKINAVISQLLDGKNIGYMSDCGTPGISDPGSRLVFEARKNDIAIIPIPGASALTALISVSGFASKNVIFAGFISKKPGRRINELMKLKEYEGTIVIYESPHRIVKTLDAIAEVFTDTKVLIGREMTKTFEEYIHFSTEEWENKRNLLTIKGEFCIAIDNKQ